MSSRFVAAPFCELGPAGTDQAIGVFGGHLDDTIFSDRDASAREGLDRADPRRRLEADIDRLRRLQFFGPRRHPIAVAIKQQAGEEARLQWVARAALQVGDDKASIGSLGAGLDPRDNALEETAGEFAPAVVSGYGDLAPVFDLIFHFRAGTAAERVPRPWV